MKKRLIANNPESGQLRYSIYRRAISRTKEAIEKGYFLEAITLCESLISDRLESRLNYLTNSQDYSFKNLGWLQKELMKCEDNADIKEFINFRNSELTQWRDRRNKALHEMAKIEESDERTWEIKMEECEEIAKKGEELRKKLFQLIDKNNKR